jgi:peptidoglycan/LPS O-acetylase OafA/YrhL
LVPSSNLTYRPEIDGLRALAVLPVILFHAGIDFFGGGFVGVDVFFVISGYLITTIIIKELDEGKFSLVNFYERRARRILPALFVVLIFTCIPAWFWMTPDELKNFSQSLVAVATYASNILFWITRGYFSPAAEEVPLLHTWSLGIEEQYYVIFPLLLMLLWKVRVARLSVLLGLLLVASFAVSDWSSVRAANTNFYLLHTRGWELLVGSMAAIALYRGWIQREKLSGQNQLLSLLGVALIVIAILSFDNSTPFPGRYALLPVIGTALIICFAAPGGIVHRLLSLKWVVGIGLISYSSYLWHQPLFALARIKGAGEPSAYMFGILTFVTFALAYLSWRFIENPLRNKKRFSRRFIFVGALAGSLLFIVIGLAGHVYDGFPSRFSDNQVALGETAKESPRRNECHTSGLDYKTPQEACTYFEGEPTWALFGDSHGVELSYAIAEQLAFQGESLTHLTFSDCGVDFIKSEYRNDNPGCEQWIEESVDWMIGNDRLETVVVAFYHSAKYRGAERYAERSGSENEYLKKFDQLLERLVRSGKRILLVQPVPSLEKHIEEYVFFPEVGSGIENISIPYSDYEKRTQVVRQHFQGLAAEYPGNVRLVDPSSALCENDVCFGGTTNELYYFDSHHLSLVGARKVARLIFE